MLDVQTVIITPCCCRLSGCKLQHNKIFPGRGYRAGCAFRRHGILYSGGGLIRVIHIYMPEIVFISGLHKAFKIALILAAERNRINFCVCRTVTRNTLKRNLIFSGS